MRDILHHLRMLNRSRAVPVMLIVLLICGSVYIGYAWQTSLLPPTQAQSIDFAGLKTEYRKYRGGSTVDPICFDSQCNPRFCVNTNSSLDGEPCQSDSQCGSGQCYDNWWEEQIGCPTWLASAIINGITSGPSSNRNSSGGTVNYINTLQSCSSYRPRPSGSGANGAWLGMGKFSVGLALDDPQITYEAAEFMAREAGSRSVYNYFAPGGEGITQDWAHYTHQQEMQNHYGGSYLNDMATYMAITQNDPIVRVEAFPGVYPNQAETADEVMCNWVQHHVRWVNRFDPSSSSPYWDPLTSSKFPQSARSRFERGVDTLLRKTNYCTSAIRSSMSAMLSGNTLNGAMSFPIENYLAIQRPNYTAGLRMTELGNIALEASPVNPMFGALSIVTNNTIDKWYGDEDNGGDSITQYPHRLQGLATIPRDHAYTVAHNYDYSEGYGGMNVVRNNWPLYSQSTLSGHYAAGGEWLRGGNFSMKKSWFFFDNEIVSLGSDISDPSGIDTWLNSFIKGDPNFSSNGGSHAVPTRSGTDLSSTWLTQSVTDMGTLSWLYHDQTGYVFPETEHVRARGILTDYRGPMSQVYLAHSQDNDPRYAVVYLPATTQSATQNYNDLTIIDHSGSAHVVKENSSGTVGAVIFSSNYTNSAVSSNLPATIMYRQVGGEVEFSLYNPHLESQTDWWGANCGPSCATAGQNPKDDFDISPSSATHHQYAVSIPLAITGVSGSCSGNACNAVNVSGGNTINVRLRVTRKLEIKAQGGQIVEANIGFNDADTGVITNPPPACTPNQSCTTSDGCTGTCNSTGTQCAKNDPACPVCTPGGACTINSCSGTYICQNNQQICQDTPGDNCPANNLCNNGQIDGNEQCDGNNHNGQTCQTLGFTDGNLSCNQDCTFNLNNCTGGTVTACYLKGFTQCNPNLGYGGDPWTDQCLTEAQVIQWCSGATCAGCPGPCANWGIANTGCADNGANQSPNRPLLSYVGIDNGGGACGVPGQTCTIDSCPGTCDTAGNTCQKTDPQCGTACIPGGACTINSCPGTYICQNNQRICQDTPGDNCPTPSPTYYLDPAGNDSNDGISQTTPWRTVAKVNATQFQPGSQILFKRGGEWREKLTMSSSGTAGNPIIIGAYGTGSKPILNGSALATSWSNISGNIWKATVPEPLEDDPDVNMVAMNNTRGVRVNTQVELAAEYQYWHNTVSNEIFIYAPSSPISRYTNPGVEISIRFGNIYLNGKNYITVQNLRLAKSNSRAVNLHTFPSDNIIIEDVDADLCGRTFVSGETGSDNWTVRRNTITHCGENRDNDGMYIQDGSNNWQIYENRISYSGGDDVAIVGGTGHRIYGNTLGPSNAGEISTGVTVLDAGNDVQIYDNEIFDHDVYGIVIKGSNVKVFRNNIHGNGWDTGGGNGGGGILTNGAGANTGLEIHNNLIWGHTFQNGGIDLWTGGDNAKIYANTITGNKLGIGLHKNGADTKDNVDIKNNIIANHSGAGIVIDQAVSPIIANNNVVNNAGGNYSGTTDRTGQNGNLSIDPQFVNEASGDFHLRPNSPMIDSGAALGTAYAADFEGTIRPQGTAWDIGADEIGSADSQPPTITAFTLQSRAADAPVIFTWHVTDNLALKQIELWRTSDQNGQPNASQWAPVAGQAVHITGTQAGNPPLLVDTPPSGTWWYGAHALDQVDNVGHEPSPPGPIKAIMATASTQCADGQDNDGDALTDYPSDPGCANAQDNDEYNPPPGQTNFNPPFPRIGVLYFYEVNIPEEIWKNKDLVAIRYWYPQIAQKVKSARPTTIVLGANNVLDGQEILTKPGTPGVAANPALVQLTGGTNPATYAACHGGARNKQPCTSQSQCEDGNPGWTSADGSCYARCILGWHWNTQPGNCMYDPTDTAPTLSVFGNKRWNQYLPEWVNAQTNWSLYDGIFWDSWKGSISWETFADEVNIDGVPGADGISRVDGLWVAGNAKIVQNLRSIAPAGKGVQIAHESSETEHAFLNGRGFEYWKGFDWQWVYDNILAPYAQHAVSPRVNFIEGNGEITDYNRMRFGLTTAALADAYFYYEQQGTAHLSDYHYDEFIGDLGHPTGPATAIRPSVYVRYFDRGAVITNGSGANQTVSSSDLSGGPYYRFRGGQDPSTNNGQQFTSITLQGSGGQGQGQTGDGIILFRQPTTLVGDIIVDNVARNMTSPGSNPVSYSGSWTQQDMGAVQNTFGYALGYGWDQYGPPYAKSAQASATAAYQPTIGVAGDYDVYEWHPDTAADGQGAGCSNVQARYSGMTCTGWQGTVNQTTHIGRWNLLGRCAMSAGTAGTVTLTAPGGCTASSDAIKFAYTANTVSINDRSDGVLAGRQTRVLGASQKKPWDNTFTRHPLTRFNLAFFSSTLGLSVLLYIIIYKENLAYRGKSRQKSL